MPRLAAGRTWQVKALLDRSGTRPLAADMLALSTSASNPSDSATTLAGEITGTGGLARAQATLAYTPGATSATLTKTFIADGTGTLPVTALRVGVWTTDSTPVLVFDESLNAGATFSATGDSTTVTVTVSI